MRMTTSDQVRAVAVVVTAVAQVISSPLTTLALGPSSNTGAISDAYLSPITPAGYAFSIWGLIYLLSLALAVYQALPSQRERGVHRRTGWWLVGAFTASALWVPIFGTETIWLSQVVILVLVACLVGAAYAFRQTGPARDTAERFLLRLPVTVYLGWATLASTAGFGLTFRSFGLPERESPATAVALVLLLVATVGSVIVVARLVALAGFAFTAGWALVGIAVGTYATEIRFAALVALAVVVTVLCLRTARSAEKQRILLG